MKNISSAKKSIGPSKTTINKNNATEIRANFDGTRKFVLDKRNTPVK